MAKVLLVDDEPDQLELVRMLLSEDSHESIAVTTGEAAFLALKRHSIDLILLDVEIKSESGLDILKRIRDEISVRIPIIMLSGHQEHETIVQALDLGADDYIDKLTSPEILLARVRRRLGAAKLTAAADGRIGPYRLLEKLGEGTSAEVYRALDSRLGRDVAIKVLKPGLTIGFQTAERFRQEAQILASFRHPRVVEIFDFGDLPRPYIVLEYVEGVDLDVLLEQGLPSVKQAAEIMRSLLVTLQAIHELNLVHRDLKPSNIRMGSDGHPHLLDFGMSKLLTREDSLTPKGAILGTLKYSAPEQLNQSAVTAQTDIYGAGVVLYTLLTGQPPFVGDMSQIISQVLTTPAAKVSSLRPDGDKTLDRIVSRMLAKKPSKRHDSAMQAAEEICEACDLPPLCF